MLLRQWTSWTTEILVKEAFTVDPCGVNAYFFPCSHAVLSRCHQGQGDKVDFPPFLFILEKFIKFN